MNDLVKVVFQGVSTEESLQKLRAKYPSDIVADLTQEDEMKKARKIRAEKNNLVKSIDIVKIDFKKEVDSEASKLIDAVEKIYSHIITPFEIQDKINKDKKKEKEAERKKLLDSQLEKIRGFDGFIEQSNSKDSVYIDGIIESVEAIDVLVFDSTLVKEASQAKDRIINRLAVMRSEAIDRQKLQEENAILQAQKEKFDQQEREIAEQKAELEAMQEKLRQAEAEKEVVQEQEIEVVQQAPITDGFEGTGSINSSMFHSADGVARECAATSRDTLALLDKLMGFFEDNAIKDPRTMIGMMLDNHVPFVKTTKL